MSNMSYCRFRNTLEDLEDCYQNWEHPEDENNEEELKARKRLLKLCEKIAEDCMD